MENSLADSTGSRRLRAAAFASHDARFRYRYGAIHSPLLSPAQRRPPGTLCPAPVRESEAFGTRGLRSAHARRVRVGPPAWEGLPLLSPSEATARPSRSFGP